MSLYTFILPRHKKAQLWQPYPQCLIRRKPLVRAFPFNRLFRYFLALELNFNQEAVVFSRWVILMLARMSPFGENTKCYKLHKNLWKYHVIFLQRGTGLHYPHLPWKWRLSKARSLPQIPLKRTLQILQPEILQSLRLWVTKIWELLLQILPRILIPLKERSESIPIFLFSGQSSYNSAHPTFCAINVLNSTEQYRDSGRSFI